MAATLGVNGLVMLSGRAAARLHGWDGFTDHDLIEIVLPRGGHERSRSDVRVRWSRVLSAADRHVIGGIPVTIQPVTMIHLAADGHDAGRALDSALRQRKPPVWLRQHFERWKSHGVAGPTEMLRLLDERMGKRLPRSWFQRLASQVLSAEGIQMVDEWPVRGHDGVLLAELDLAHVQLQVGVECQSVEYHASPADLARDIVRKRALRRLGWDIVELWWTDLDRPGEVLLDVRAALDRARQLRSVSRT